MSEEIIEKLDKLAVHCMMMDESLSDLLPISEASQMVDGLRDLLLAAKPPELALPFIGLSLLYEKYILGQGDTKKAPEGVRLTNDSIEIVKAVLEGTSTFEDAEERIKNIRIDFKKLFEIDTVLPAGTASRPDNGQNEAAEQAVSGDGTAKSREGEKSPHRTEVSLMDDNDVEIYVGFLDEATDLLNKIEENLITLEEQTDNMEIINSLFRAFHSLKGAAGFLGMNEINFFCHETENMLDQARKSLLAVDSEVIDILLSARDLLEKGLGAISETVEEGKEKLPNFKAMTSQLNVGNLIELIDKKMFLADKEDEAGEEKPRLGEILVEDNAVTPKQLREALAIKDKKVGELLVDMGVTTQKDVEHAVQEQQVKEEEIKKKAVVAHTVKVDTKRLNILLELVGELVISQSIISENDVLGEELNLSLSKSIGEMAKITTGIQDQIMGLRMVPLKQTFTKMNRLVRDLARKTDKQVIFEIHGEETEIDRTIVDELNDPLVHTLRNAVDHGIDSREERLASGKSPGGIISLRAYHKGGNVVIEVSDNGRGLNMEKIKAKGLEKGLLDLKEEYSESEIIALIFHPGLSTHQVATAISGRGVGMDVVKRNVEKLGGRVDIQTKQGEGTTFFIKLPLTMAIVDGMLVSIGDERFIIPTISIDESIRPNKEQLTSVIEKGEMINVRGDLIPLIRLQNLFGISDDRKDITESLVVVVSNESQRRGFLIDNLLGQQQVVIKNLDKRFRGMRGFSGSSILGDGRVGLIIDVGGVFDLATNTNGKVLA
jgi:two-component system chemotaxis sensor kinase CheA